MPFQVSVRTCVLDATIADKNYSYHQFYLCILKCGKSLQYLKTVKQFWE